MLLGWDIRAKAYSNSVSSCLSSSTQFSCCLKSKNNIAIVASQLLYYFLEFLCCTNMRLETLELKEGELEHTSCHLPKTSLFPINLSHVNAFTFAPTPISFPECTSLFAKASRCVCKCHHTSANAPFGNRFVDAATSRSQNLFSHINAAPRETLKWIRTIARVFGT